MSASDILPILPSLLTGIWSGAAIYGPVAEHPGRMSLPPAMAHQQWIPSFKAAMAMQVSLILATAGTTAYAYYKSGNKLDMYTGLTMATILPYTALTLLPINRQLLSTSINLSSASKVELLNQWNMYHIGRACIGTTAFVMALLRLQGTK